MVGYPVAGNPMQFAAERLLAETNLDWRILSLSVAPADLEAAIRGAEAMGFAGLAIADPHRVAAGQLLGVAGPVDFIARGTDSRFVGENLVGSVILQLLQQRLTDDTAAVAILGRDCDAVGLATALREANHQPFLVDYSAAETEQLPAGIETGMPPEPHSIVLVGDAEDVENGVIADLRGGDSVRSAGTLTSIEVVANYLHQALLRWTDRDFDIEQIRELIEEYWAV